MTGPKGICDYCHQMVGSQQTGVYPVECYEEDRDGGGANKMMDRKRIDGKVWHRPCWDSMIRERDGGGSQEPLL